MNTVIEYKCPNCGGGLQFDSQSQKMKCPFCDGEFDVESLKAFDDALKSSAVEDKMDWNEQAGGEWSNGETDGMLIYSCHSCGGEIVGDATAAATKCPYCDNPVVMKSQFAGELRPDYVIPFKFDKNAAKESLKRHLMGKRLLPKVFKDENHIDEIKGIYVPFWLFDAEVKACIQYDATRVRSYSDSKYNYVERTKYLAVRGGSLGFCRIPVDGSSKMPDDLMESIEPFNYNEAVDFQTAYLSGYLADKYDVDANTGIIRANQRLRASTEQTFASTVKGYSTVTPKSSNINIQSGGSKYALCPVWILNTIWKGNRYIFAMNGQTGKFVGDLPLDKAAWRRWFWGLTLGIGLPLAAIMIMLYS